MWKKASQFFRRLFALNDTPERIARAFALGVFLAFSPLIGLHLLLGVLFAVFFGLNRFALFVGLFINNPYTLIPIYAAGTYIGSLLIGYPSPSALPSIELHSILSSNFWVQIAGQWHILKPMVLGSTVLSILVAVFSYCAAFYLIKQHRIRIGRQQCRSVLPELKI